MFPHSLGPVHARVAALPCDAETWGGGCWGIPTWLQGDLHSGEARMGGARTTTKASWSPWEPRGSGASCVAQLLEMGVAASDLLVPPRLRLFPAV